MNSITYSSLSITFLCLISKCYPEDILISICIYISRHYWIGLLYDGKYVFFNFHSELVWPGLLLSLIISSVFLYILWFHLSLYSIIFHFACNTNLIMNVSLYGYLSGPSFLVIVKRAAIKIDTKPGSGGACL